MKKKQFFIILFGLLLGAQLGIFFGAALNNQVLGVALGMLGGMFLGWFVAAIDIEHSNSKRVASSPNEAGSRKPVDHRNEK